MKILGEKSANAFDRITKFLTICSYDKNTIKDLTNNDCKVYHIDCCFVNRFFHLCHNDWLSSRKIVDALSQINQYSKNKPYVQINCISEDPYIIATFIEQKAKWRKSFKRIIVL